MVLKNPEFCGRLWRSCHELRGGVDASQYEGRLLTLLLVKDLSDKQESDRQGLIGVPLGGSDDMDGPARRDDHTTQTAIPTPWVGSPTTERRIKRVMSTANAHHTVRGINLVSKDITNLHSGVYPPLGRVRVAAPDRLDDEDVRLAIVQRLPWIKRQRQRLRSAERQSERQMVSGESIFVWGVGYRLRVIEQPGRARFEIDGSRLVLYVPAGTDSARRRELLARWRRRQLRERIPSLIDKWEPIVGRPVSRCTIRRMKTKWGSCNRESGHIWLNLELAGKHPDLLEHIVVHEMTHLVEHGHGQRFVALMDAHLPNWRALRDQLNGAPLAHEEWRQ